MRIRIPGFTYDIGHVTAGGLAAGTVGTSVADPNPDPDPHQMSWIRNTANQGQFRRPRWFLSLQVHQLHHQRIGCLAYLRDLNFVTN